MLLEELFPSRRRRQDPLDQIAAQLHDLRRQTRHLGRSLSGNARSLSHNASEVADDLGDVVSEWGRDAAKQGAWIAGVASRKAMESAKAVQRDPVPVIAVLGTTLLLTTLLFRRR